MPRFLRLAALLLGLAAPCAASALPAGVVPLRGADAPREDLRQAVLRHYAIPADGGGTSYAYAYIDLDYDGRNEILAVVRGPYASGTGGDSALLFSQTAGGLRLRQDFTLVRTPLLAAYRTWDGEASDQRPLVLTRSGGGAAAETVVLTSRDGRYGRVSDAAPVPAHTPLRGALLFAPSPDDAEPRWFSCAPDGGAL